MWELIVLGLVPGTQFEITFALWLVAVGATVIVLTGRIARRFQLIEKSLITATLLVATRRFHPTA